MPRKVNKKKPSQILIWNSELSMPLIITVKITDNFRSTETSDNVDCGEEEAEGGLSPTPDKVSTVELASVVLM